MAISTMYPAMPGSPVTSLTSGIAADATSMTLDDATVLPTAPNICVIGADSSAEIVSYTAITGNVVSGLVRGLGGTTASAWQSNTAVARNITSLDHNTFMGNITDLDTRVQKNMPIHLSVTASQGTTSVTKSDARITSSMRVINCVFGTPSSVATNVTWSTSNGSVTFSVTSAFTGSTTINFDLVEVN